MPRGLPPHGGLSSWIMSNQKHIVLAGGGTAGHVNPLLAVAHVIRELEPEADIAVVGTAVGLERDLVPQAGFELETIEKVPFPRRPNKAALQFPAKWKAEKAKVRDILTRHQAQVVVGFGGYTSAPVYAAAHSMGIPIAIHEQNARAGMANKLGARWASMIGAAYAQPGLRPRRASKSNAWACRFVRQSHDWRPIWNMTVPPLVKPPRRSLVSIRTVRSWSSPADPWAR